jgi:hypothetical protein
MLADDDVTALLHKTSRILRLVDDDVTQQEDSSSSSSSSSSGANHVLLLHVWMFSAFACGFTSLEPNSQEVVKKLAKFHKRENPRFVVTHTRPFQIPNSTALVTTLPATAKQTRCSRRESRERERERERERASARENRERGEKTLKGKGKADNDGRYVCFELSSNNNAKKRSQGTKEGMFVVCTQRSLEYKRFSREKKTQENKETNHKLMRGEAKMLKIFTKLCKRKRKTRAKQNRTTCATTNLSPQSLLTFFFGCLPVLPDSHDDPHVFYVSSR